MISRIVVLAVFWLLIPHHAYALDPGFYSAVEQKEEIDFIFSEETRADRVIWYDRSKNFNIGLNVTRNDVRQPIYLTLEELVPFLRSEKHKDFLVIWFDKTIMWGGPVNAYIIELENAFRTVGYKRILFLGAHCCGVHLLKDVNN